MSLSLPPTSSPQKASFSKMKLKDEKPTEKYANATEYQNKLQTKSKCAHCSALILPKDFAAAATTTSSVVGWATKRRKSNNNRYNINIFLCTVSFVNVFVFEPNVWKKKYSLRVMRRIKRRKSAPARLAHGMGWAEEKRRDENKKTNVYVDRRPTRWLMPYQFS